MAEFVNQDELNTFESWLKSRAIDAATCTPDELLSWRWAFEESLRRKAAPSRIGLAKSAGLQLAWPLVASLLMIVVALGAAAMFAKARARGRQTPVDLSLRKRPTGLQPAAGELQTEPGRAGHAKCTRPVKDHARSCCALRAGSQPSEAEKARAATKKLLDEQVHLVTAGREWLSKQAGYRATFVKQERVQGVLNPVEIMRIILRQAPFAVRLDWLESGQRAAYVDGENGDMLLVRLGGAKRLLGTLKLDPNGVHAMRSTRYPITEIGLWNMAERVSRECARALQQTGGVTCQRLPDEDVGDRACAIYVIDYPSPGFSSEIRTIRSSIDREWGVPLRFQATGWCEPASDRAAGVDNLLELYEYRDVVYADCMQPADFNLSTKVK